MKTIQKYYNYFMIVVLLFILFNGHRVGTTELVLISFTTLLCFLVPRMLVRDSLTIYILSIVLLFMVVYQPIDSIIHADIYIKSIRTSSELIFNKNLRETYCLYCMIYYLVFVFADIMLHRGISRRVYKITILRNAGKVSLYFNIFYVAIIWSVIRYSIQTRFHILYAGQQATISHSGVIIYLIRIITLYIWASAIQQIKATASGVGVFVRNSLIMAIICGAPQAYIGTRSEILIFLIQILIIVFLYYGNDKASIGKIFGVVLIVIIISAISVYIAYYFRTGVTRNVLSFLAERIVGLVDGINVINYSKSGGKNLPVSNFFKAIVSADDTLYISTFYTHYICGYAMDLIHSWSIPGFGSGLLYGNMVGMIVFTFMQGIVCSIVERKMKKCLNERRLDMFKATCLLYLYVQLLFICIFEGSIDRVSNFVLIAVAALIMHRFISLSKVMKTNVV